MYPLLRFEVVRRLRLISTWIFVSLFFGLGFLFVAAGAGAISGVIVDLGAGSKVPANAPLSLAFAFALAGHLGVMVNASVTGRVVCDDIESKMAPLVYSAPIGERRFIAGRFLGAMATMLLYLPAIGVGAWAATFMPGIDPQRIAANHFEAYAAPFVTLLLPNLVITTSLFFAVALWTRRMLPVLVSGCVLLLGYLVASSLIGDVERRTLSALLDPFGLRALDAVTKYWTVAERIERPITFEGLLLANRVLWMAVALGVLAFSARRFSFSAPSGDRPAIEVPEDAAAASAPVGTSGKPRFDLGAELALVGHLARMHVRETARGGPFLVLMLAAALFIVVQGTSIDAVYGTPTYPVTYEMLEVVGGGFSIFLIVFIAVYAGELVHRERTVGLSSIADALPTPTWITFVAKLVGLLFLVAVLELGVVAGGVMLQVVKGYTHFELGLYFRSLYLVSFPAYAAFVALALAIHAIVDNKPLGHLLVTATFVSTILLPVLGLEHHLYLYASAPRYTYSDMNGFGPFVRPILVFRTYWIMVSAAVLVVGYVAWLRGAERSARARLLSARASLTAPVGAALGVAIVLAVSTGAYAFHNTNTLNKYETELDGEKVSAELERKYAALAADPRLRVTALKLDLDLYPAERRAIAHGVATIENGGKAPATRVLVTFPEHATIDAFDLGDAKVIDDQPKMHLRVYQLAAPLGPGEKATLEYKITYSRPGFVNGTDDGRIVDNGSFFISSMLPALNYERGAELSDPQARKRQKLPPRPRMRDLDDPVGREKNYIVGDGDWVTLEVTVTAPSDRLAIGPGSLVDSHEENGRKTFHYRTKPLTPYFFGVLSARFEVKKETYAGVELEIDYHKGHEYDLDRMMEGMKLALDYANENFGPYQHDGIRIIEFPRYAKYAQSLPGIIPYSESIGFLARVEDGPEAVDLPLYVTAHEVGHQWWGHQVTGADVQGSTVLSETLAEYTALMVMKKKVGRDNVQRFLKYELDRYLSARGREKDKEVPLLRVENQPYIHYSKGALVMYRVQELLGEDVVNRCLADLVAAERFKGPPYPTARALYGRLVDAAPPEVRPALADLFERITLFELRAVSAKATKTGGDEYDVEIAYSAQKFGADADGKETEQSLDEMIEFGVYDAKKKSLAIEMRRVNEKEGKVVLHVKGEPIEAGIDPVHVFIDRKPDDNRVKIDR